MILEIGDMDISRAAARVLLGKYDDEPPANGPRYNPLKSLERYRDGYDLSSKVMSSTVS